MSGEEEQEVMKGTGEAAPEEVLKDFYTVKQIANKFEVSSSWISKLLGQGRIRGFKPFGGQWRIPKAEAERLFSEGIPPIPREEVDRPTTVIKVPTEKVHKVQSKKQQKESTGKDKGAWFPLPFDLD